MVQVLPMDARGRLQDASDIRCAIPVLSTSSMRRSLADLEINDLQFLHGTDVPTIALICIVRLHACRIRAEPHQEDGRKLLKTYKLHIKAGELAEGPWPKIALDANATTLIPGAAD